MKFRWREAKLCLLESGIFAINSSFGFGNSTDIWRSSFTNVFDILLLLMMCIITLTQTWESILNARWRGAKFLANLTTGFYLISSFDLDTFW